MNDINSNQKLCIVDYFDKLTNQIDIDTETLIEKFYSSQEIKDELNRLRLLYLNEVKRVELANLKQVQFSPTSLITHENRSSHKFEAIHGFLFYIEHFYLEKIFEQCKCGVLVELDIFLSNEEIILIK
jgi:hypothetical protein